MSVEVLIGTNSTILTLTIITKQDSIITLEKPTPGIYESIHHWKCEKCDNLFILSRI